MKHLVKFLILLSLISCINKKESKREEDYSFKKDSTFSNFYRSSPLFVNDTFRTFLDKIATINSSKKHAFALNFVLKQKSIPIIKSDTVVHFLFWGNDDSVAVAGDMTGWTPTLKLKNIRETKLWYASETYPSSTRIEYKIVVGSSNWMLDSLNKQVVLGGMGKNSELTLPAYTKPSLIFEIDSVPKGKYYDELVQSKFLKEERKIRIYFPPGYENSTVRYPVIMFHDGIQFFEMTSSFNMFNNLIYLNKIQPFIAVFVEPVQRDEEYSGELQEKYTNFITKELVPSMDSSFRTIPNAANRAQAGISNGGNIALWIVASNPETFNKVAALSSNVQNKIIEKFDHLPPADLKIYLLMGKYDLPILIPRIKRLENVLLQNNYQLKFCEYPEGHNWAFWQKYMPDALEYLFPAIKN